MHTIKFTGVPFRSQSFVILAIIGAEITSREGQNLPSLSRARDSQTLASARVNASQPLLVLSGSFQFLSDSFSASRLL